MTSAAAFIIVGISLSSVAGKTQDRHFGGFGPRPGGFGGFRPGSGGFGGFRPGSGGFGGSRPLGGRDLGDLFTESGIVPDLLDSAPQSPLMVFWDSGLTLTSPNQTVDTSDLMNAPSVMFRGSFDRSS